MANGIIVLIIAFIFIKFGLWFNKSEEREKIRLEHSKQTVGIIDRVVHSDVGNVKYYIVFNDNNESYLGQSGYYSNSMESLNPGDEVNIKYYFSKKGRPFAHIIDDTVDPLSNHMKGTGRGSILIGIGFIVLAICMFLGLIS